MVAGRADLSHRGVAIDEYLLTQKDSQIVGVLCLVVISRYYFARKSLRKADSEK